MGIKEIFTATPLFYLTVFQIYKIPFEDVVWVFELERDRRSLFDFAGFFTDYSDLEKSEVVSVCARCPGFMKFILYGYLCLKQECGRTDEKVFPVILKNIDIFFGETS